MTVSWGGLFGKAPVTGDFIARGLPPGMRRGLDAWLSATLAGRAGLWPPGGVRALVLIDGSPVLICAVQSLDSAGRTFPLAAATDARRMSYEVAEAWCDRLGPMLEAVAASETRLEDVETLVADLSRRLPRDAEDGLEAIWHRAGPPMEIDDDALGGLFSSA